jgi:hypothetical protein
MAEPDFWQQWLYGFLFWKSMGGGWGQHIGQHWSIKTDRMLVHKEVEAKRRY